MILLSVNFIINAQNSLCENLDFSNDDFTNWTGYTSVYPNNTTGANIGNFVAYYYNQGIVNGRHTIINQSTNDPFTCGNVTTIPAGEKQSVRLGNGGVGWWGNGVGWQRDYLEYTMSVTPANALLVYKYAVVLQDPNSDPGIAPHADPIKPRFVVSIKDENGALIDPNCGIYSVTADESVEGFRNCTQGQAQANGGQFSSNGSTIYRAWTTVGVDLRDFIGQDITILFETWDCGLGGHFGYAYLTAKCDSLGIEAQNCGANDGVTLTAPEGFSYQWSTGQSTQTIDIDNAIAGDSVWVELTTKSGCSSDLHTILNPAKIQAVFKANENIACVGESISFTDSSWSKFLLDNSGVPITAKTWRFADGTVISGNQSDVSHTFSDFGVQSITLIVENDFGCIDSVIKYVNIRPLPVADFSFEPDCKGNSTVFESTSLIEEGDVVEYYWDIGAFTDGQDKTEYTFADGEVMEASLKVVSDYGCVDSITAPVDMWPLPTAIFIGGSACSGKSLDFVNNSTSDLADPVESFKWGFGDNSALSILENSTHVYDSAGSFNVKLEVETERGCVDDTIIPVTILQGPKIDFSFGEVCLNTEVTFLNETEGKDSVSNWYWDFGDGGGSNDEEPDYTYLTSDVFDVKLKGVTPAGCEDSLEKSLFISAIPDASFKAEDVCLTEETEFLDQSIVSTGDTDSWEWYFGDGNSSSEQNPLHIYDTAGTYTVKFIVASGIGCKDSVEAQVTVFPGPEANFDNTEICFGEVTEFDNLTTSKLLSPIEYLWEFGNGALQTELEEPTLKYSASGDYEVTLFATQEGCTSEFEKMVKVKPRPIVDFTNLAVCLGVENKLLNNTESESAIATWEWSFKELGTQSNLEFPAITVNSGDTFSVELIATAQNGCADTLNKVLKISPNPIVDFRYEEKCQGDELNFISQATVDRGYISTWEWDFGEGTIVNDKDPVYTYDTSGVLNVKLKASTSGFCTDSVIIPIQVYGRPVAKILATEVCMGEITSLNDSSYVNNGTINSLEWNVGDGSLIKSSQNLQHQYPKPDEFLVELYVETDKGCKDTSDLIVTVNPNPEPDFSTESVCFESDTYFENETIDKDYMVSWEWNLGDGTESLDENPIHIYSVTGLVNVSLTTVDTNGCQSVKTKPLIIKDLPQPLFDANKYDGCKPLEVNFADYSLAPLDTISEWRWDFGDGDTSDIPFPVKTYEVDGEFDVSLMVTTVNGCVNHLTWDSMITVYPLPVADFDLSSEHTDILNSTIEFTDQSIGTDYWRWEFGDNQVSSDQHPINYYKDYGDFEITQIVSTRFGCADTIIKPLRIEPVFKVYAANAFTPNSDDVNDKFKPSGIGFETDPSKYTFQIFNRWGDKIWETNDVNEEWDGKVNTFNFLNTKKVQQVDVYVWKLIVWDITDQNDRHVLFGTVALIK